MTNLIIREWLNGGLIPLNVCIIFIISYTLVDARRAYGRGWSSRPGVASACALWWIFLADLIRSSLAWSILHAQAQGRPLLYLEGTRTFLYMTAAAIATIATLRLIYNLSPTSWGHKGWIFALGLSAGFVLVLALL